MVLKNQASGIIAEKESETSDVCCECGVSHSPLWRRGPNQERLCNACGLKHRYTRSKIGQKSIWSMIESIKRIESKMDISFFLNDDEESTTSSTASISSSSNSSQGVKKISISKKKFPVSPFMIFCREKRKDLVMKNPTKNFGEISKELGILWRNLNRDEQDLYYEKHRMAKANREKSLESTTIKTLLQVAVSCEDIE